MSVSETMSLLHHGGRLQNAIAEFGGNQQSWLDLSTGVSPWHYPVPELPVACWNRLPEENDGLIAIADKYYAGHKALPIAGSQAAIQCIPKVLATQLGGAGIVLLPKVGYKEHERAWRKLGWCIEYYGDVSTATCEDEISFRQCNENDADKTYYPSTSQLSRCDALVVINPNNPAGQLVARSVLEDWLQRLSKRGATLVIDEAFMDMTPEQSILPCNNANLIVLRSIGKFFGLAGIRAGFVFASKAVRTAIHIELGPWCLNGPARAMCKLALADVAWQQMQIKRLNIASQRLRVLLDKLPGKVVGTDLFQTIYLANAPLWHKALCQQQVFTRLTDEQDALRFGLPVDESQWQRLTEVLNELSELEQIDRSCEPTFLANSSSSANAGSQS